jgi:lysophospholipase L1-like esterase
LDAATRPIPRAGRARRRSGALLLLASLLVCAALLEALARGWWWIRDGVPPSAPELLLEALYPELRPVRERPPAARDGTFDLLLLGGSVLHESWGQVEAQILEQLARAGHRSVRVHNLAQAAHTTRDSLTKYAALGDARFDLVFVYHGINDARANAAPPEVFREDYSHLPWYELVNALAPAADGAVLALPATARFALARLRQSLLAGRYAGSDRPRPEWLRYGAEPRSAAAFERNLAGVLELAARRGDRVALATFALHVPPDYSLEAFREKRLDYLLFYSPIELWGERDHVVAAVAAHNAVVRRLAARPGVLLVDQDRLVPRGARTFNDPCHLTNEGSEIFARNLVDAILASSGVRR